MRLKVVMPILFILFYTIIGMSSGSEWAGADELAEQKIHEITGGDYKPWMNPVWEPPSGEIETFFFALQAAIGALIIGYLLGYYKGQEKATKG